MFYRVGMPKVPLVLRPYDILLLQMDLHINIWYGRSEPFWNPDFYNRIYFRINTNVRKYIKTLILFSLAFPVSRLISVQEITPMEIPSEIL